MASTYSTSRVSGECKSKFLVVTPRCFDSAGTRFERDQASQAQGDRPTLNVSEASCRHQAREQPKTPDEARAGLAVSVVRLASSTLAPSGVDLR